MRKDKFKIQIGDVLYKADKSYNRVFKIEIVDIWLEDYIGGNKTIIKGKSEFGTKEYFVGDVLYFYNTEEEAAAALKEVKQNG